MRASGKVKSWVGLLLTYVAALLVVVIVSKFLPGCKDPSVPGAEAAYQAELLSCVEKAQTLKESRACRKLVHKKYGLCERKDWPRVTPCDEEDL